MDSLWKGQPAAETEVLAVRRTGIELSASRCSLVDVEAVPRRGRRVPDVRVRSFVTIPDVEGPAHLAAELRALLDANKVPRHAWVTLWDVRSTHQLVQMASARRSELQAMARRHAIQSGLASSPDGSDVVSAFAASEKRHVFVGPSQRDVVLVSALSSDIRERLQPILDAGFTVDGVVTPAEALWAQARLRRAVTPGDVHAYVALSATASAVTIVRDGLPLFSHELNWGYRGGSKKGADPIVSLNSPASGEKLGSDPFSREELAEQLASELRRSFIFAKQYSDRPITQLLLCGDMPELRSLTGPLIDLLDVEVETLDSLEGIDATVLPEPAEAFREQIAGLRLALAVAAQPPPVNLIPPEQRPPVDTRRYRSLLGRSSAAAAVACAVMYGYASVQASRASSELEDLKQQMAALTPRLRAVEATRADAGLESARWAALIAFDTQGARMARILETLSQAAPPEMTVRSLTVRTDGPSWRVSIAGHVESSDPARAQTAVNNFLALMQHSPLVGPPVRSPYLKITTSGGGVAGATEFAVEYSVRK